jgi:Tfp pilus assembly protein PilF
LALIAISGWIAHRAAPVFAQTNDVITLVALRPPVEVLPHDSRRWLPAAPGLILEAFDRVRIGPDGFATILWSNSGVNFGALTELEIRPPATSGTDQGLHLIKGILSFFHRGKPGRINVLTSGAFAGIEGTEFVMRASGSNDTEQTELSVIDGTVRFTNQAGQLVLSNGQQAVAQPGKAPALASGFIAKNLLQWCFYYPGILDTNDPPSFTEEEKTHLSASLASYGEGDLPAALRNYPAGQRPGSDTARLYHAALLLGAGQVAPAEADLSALTNQDAAGRSQRLAMALRTLMAAVKRQARPSAANPQLSTEYLAESYFEQSRALPDVSLPAALKLAREAVARDAGFGFGWERVAELEFSFGRIEQASEALDKALELSPRNAQALALKGFLLAAWNKTRPAIESFNSAMAVDSALGNAWLGRGLCRIRRGDLRDGQEDLLVAATLEPGRASLRNYLAKGWSQSGDDRLALKELQRAIALDPNDPTAWLYSALIKEEDNRINEAVGDLEKSEDLNDNRTVYRSGVLLDQDRAVRSANLARIYDEAGLEDVALREASKGVESDYANYSAHMFLANTYDRLLNESPGDLRYETPAVSEYLVASLLGPADGRLLAQPVSQEQYTTLLDRDGPGVFSSTEYLSRGAWDQYESQYGTLDNTSYALEAEYATDPGELPDQDSLIRTFSFKLKQQITPNDQLYGQILEYQNNGGFLSSVYAASNINTSFRFEEKQEPDLLLGYHHEWGPGQHTLLLISRYNDTYDYSAADSPSYLLHEQNNALTGVQPMSIDTVYRHQEDIYSGDLQQIWETTSQTLVAGTRLQWGDAQANNLQTNPGDGVQPLFPPPSVPAAVQTYSWHFSRYNVYAYDHWHVANSLTLIGGLSFDQVTLPRNDNSPPLDLESETLSQVSPKAGFNWTPADTTTFRGAYTRSLGGFNLDQSVRLEPTEIAGFVQGYRSVIPESVTGAIGGERFDTYDLDWEQKLTPHTYFTLTGELLDATVDHDIGAFVNSNFTAQTSMPSSLTEDLYFREWSVEAALRQIVSRELTLGADYRRSDARLHFEYPGVSQAASNPGFPQSYAEQGLLHSLLLQATFNHSSGCFALVQGRWVAQSNSGADSNLPGDSFWQLDLFAGYRFPRRHAEISLGLLNATSQNYNLNPVNLYTELARTRTVVAKFQFNF